MTSCHQTGSSLGYRDTDDPSRSSLWAPFLMYWPRVGAHWKCLCFIWWLRDHYEPNTSTLNPLPHPLAEHHLPSCTKHQMQKPMSGFWSQAALERLHLIQLSISSQRPRAISTFRITGSCFIWLRQNLEKSKAKLSKCKIYFKKKILMNDNQNFRFQNLKTEITKWRIYLSTNSLALEIINFQIGRFISY